jgi:hypothetical protein
LKVLRKTVVEPEVRAITAQPLDIANDFGVILLLEP